MVRWALTIRLGAIGGICPNHRAGIAAIEHVAELGAVIGRGAGDVPAADEAVLAVDPGVVLGAEVGTGDVAPLL